MNKSILFKILLITSCTLLTTIKVANAEQLLKSSSSEEAISVVQMKLDGDKDTVLDKHDQCPNSPAGNDVDRYGCTKYAKSAPIKAEVITISLLVNFETDKYNIDEKYFSEINQVANFLKHYPNTSLVIEGHTSSQGNAKYNKRLSQQRANEIVNVLINEFNIDSNRLSAIGFGEEQLIDSADTAEAHTINRRVEGKVSTGE